MDYSAIHGFNYQPSYGSSGFELWQKFDAATIETELGRGRRFFPQMNAIRLWLSHDSWMRDRGRFERSFETALAIAARYGLVVMPVLFNRWHDPTLDYGGIYLDHFLPTVSWVQGVDQPMAFTEAIVGAHARDSRVFAWDLCNEPFSYHARPDEIPDIVSAERGWLERLYRRCKDLGAVAPVTVGTHPGTRMDDVLECSDLLGIHPYWVPNSQPDGGRAQYEKLLDDYLALSERTGKPLLATETCWGSTDDAQRVEIIRYTLGELKKRRIGWLVYLLHHSLIADAHRAKFGPIGSPGNLSFIEADGSLRPRHDIYNEF